LVPSVPPPKYPALGTVGNVKSEAKEEFGEPPKEEEEVAESFLRSQNLNGPLDLVLCDTVSLE
jgi:hypothetical protein